MADNRKKDDSGIKINEPAENDEMMEAAGSSTEAREALKREIEREMEDERNNSTDAAGALPKDFKDPIRGRGRQESAAAQESRSRQGTEGRGRSRSRENAKRLTPREPDRAAAAQEVSFTGEKAKKGVPAGAVKPKSGKKKKAAAAGGILAVLLVICGGVYFAMAQQYRTVFFPNTEINGVDASGKTPEEVKRLISDGIDGYVLTVKEREGKTEQITKEDLGLHPIFDGSLETMLSAQNPYQWLMHQFKPSHYALKTMVAYDKTAFEQTLKNLDCMNPALMQAPENAKISDYSAGGYTIIPESSGSQVIEEKLEQGIADAVTNLKTEVSIADMGGYEAPKITKDDPGMTALLDKMNRSASVKVTYQFGDKSEILDGSRIHQWLRVNADNTVGVDSGKIADYVSELASKYDTFNKAKTLKTSYGSTITVRGGSYGWRINQSEEAAALKSIILSGESQTREPIYAQTAASHGGNDYGDTYVEINLTAQHLFYYENGSLAIESDFVSGNIAKGLGTPAGTYPLNYKQKNAVLKGANYRTPVDYWMPFNGGIGMHDATWRSSFGGNIYQNGGSHGCINLPHNVAKKIFESIKPGTPVLCYNLSGTEQSGTSSTRPPETAPAQTAPPQTEAPPETLEQGVFSPTQAPVKEPPPSQPAGPGSGTSAQPTGQGSETSAQPTSAQSAGQGTAQPPVPGTAPAGPGSDTGSGHGSGPGSP